MKTGFEEEFHIELIEGILRPEELTLAKNLNMIVSPQKNGIIDDEMPMS